MILTLGLAVLVISPLTVILVGSTPPLHAATPDFQIQTIVATLSPPYTYFVANVSVNGQHTLNYQWSNTNTCGNFTSSGSTATWDHGNTTNCSHSTPYHDGTITVTVADETGFSLSCADPNGSRDAIIQCSGGTSSSTSSSSSSSTSSTSTSSTTYTGEPSTVTSLSTSSTQSPGTLFGSPLIWLGVPLVLLVLIALWYFLKRKGGALLVDFRASGWDAEKNITLAKDFIKGLKEVQAIKKDLIAKLDKKKKFEIPIKDLLSEFAQQQIGFYLGANFLAALLALKPLQIDPDSCEAVSDGNTEITLEPDLQALKSMGVPEKLLPSKIVLKAKIIIKIDCDELRQCTLKLKILEGVVFKRMFDPQDIVIDTKDGTFKFGLTVGPNITLMSLNSKGITDGCNLFGKIEDAISKMKDELKKETNEKKKADLQKELDRMEKELSDLKKEQEALKAFPK